MDIPDPALLQQTNSGEAAVGSVREDTVRPGALNQDIGRTTESVGSVLPSSADVQVMFRATIATGDMEGKTHLFAKEIKSVYRDGDHFVLLASTATGELFKLEILPIQSLIVLPAPKVQSST